MKKIVILALIAVSMMLTAQALGAKSYSTSMGVSVKVSQSGECVTSQLSMTLSIDAENGVACLEYAAGDGIHAYLASGVTVENGTYTFRNFVVTLADGTRCRITGAMETEDGLLVIARSHDPLPVTLYFN